MCRHAARLIQGASQEHLRSSLDFHLISGSNVMHMLVRVLHAPVTWQPERSACHNPSGMSPVCCGPWQTWYLRCLIHSQRNWFIVLWCHSQLEDQLSVIVMKSTLFLSPRCKPPHAPGEDSVSGSGREGSVSSASRLSSYSTRLTRGGRNRNYRGLSSKRRFGP